MPKILKFKRKPARLVNERRCKHRIDYTTYPRQGVKSRRTGHCYRWTMNSCGLCDKHCQVDGCYTHSIMWKVVKEGRG